MSKRVATLVFGLMVWGGQSSATALEPEDVLFFKVGPLTLRPQVGVSETFNDNIFYSSVLPKSDLVSTISPGLKLQLGRPEHNYIALNYTLDQLFYADNSDLNTQQHTIEIRDKLEGQRLSLIGSDRIQFLSSPLGGVVERIVGPGGLTTFAGRNVDRMMFEDIYTLSYSLGEKTAIYLRANHSAADYESGIGLYDSQTLTGTAGFAYRAFTKTFFFGELYDGLTTTDPNESALPENPRFDFLGGYVGARGNFTEKLSGTVKVGYENREFSDGTPAPSDPVVDLYLMQRFSPKQALALTYSRQNSVSVQYSRQTFTADNIGLQFTQALGHSGKWQATLGANYSIYVYEESGTFPTSTRYNYLRASANLAYQIQRWLTANVGYDFDRVTSDTRGLIDYDVNRVTLRLNIGF